MSKENYWKYYCDFDVPCGGLSVSPKCVRLIDWEKFAPIANEVFKINDEYLTKRLKLKDVELFDYVVDYMLDFAEANYGQKELGLILLASMFQLAYRLPIEPMIKKENGESYLCFMINNNEDDLISYKNYREVREVIMEQSLIYEPIVAPNKKSQDAIDKAIERMRNSGSNVETNLESMIILVSKTRTITEDYTYYQLMADYEMVIRLEQYRALPTYRAVGADVPNMNLGEILDMHRDPYSADVMFKRNDRAKDAEKLKGN